MKLFNLKNAVVASGIGLFGLMGSASAQNVNEEYRECIRAQRQMQREYNDYARNGGRGNYRDWLRSQNRAQQECSEYQSAAQNRYYNRNNRTVYNNGYGNQGYYNNGYGNQGYYRVRRSNGGYYQTDQRGVELLRQAVNAGYQQGYQQGQMDRQYRRGGSYYGNSVYSQGTYGYQSYVERGQYQHYFQQGFQRGYQDGYNSRSQYGYRSNNSMNILGTILNGILQISR